MNKVEHTSIKLRAYLNSAQQSQFAQDSGNCRKVYNHFLERKTKEYEHWVELGRPKHWKGWSNYYDFQPQLSWLRNNEKEFDYLKLTLCDSLRESLNNLDVAFKRFLKGQSRYPKFHNKFGKQSICFPSDKLNESHFLQEGNNLFVKLPMN